MPYGISVALSCIHSGLRDPDPECRFTTETSQVRRSFAMKALSTEYYALALIINSHSSALASYMAFVKQRMFSKVCVGGWVGGEGTCVCACVRARARVRVSAMWMSVSLSVKVTACTLSLSLSLSG